MREPTTLCASASMGIALKCDSTTATRVAAYAKKTPLKVIWMQNRLICKRALLFQRNVSFKQLRLARNAAIHIEVSAGASEIAPGGKIGLALESILTVAILLLLLRMEMYLWLCLDTGDDDDDAPAAVARIVSIYRINKIACPTSCSCCDIV